MTVPARQARWRSPYFGVLHMVAAVNTLRAEKSHNHQKHLQQNQRITYTIFFSVNVNIHQIIILLKSLSPKNSESRESYPQSKRQSQGQDRASVMCQKTEPINRYPEGREKSKTPEHRAR